MSSTTTTVRRKDRSAAERDPTRARRPSASAVSVDMATPQPPMAGVPAVIAR